MLRSLLIPLTLLPFPAAAQSVLNGVNGAWAIGSPAACAGSSYDWTVLSSDAATTIIFRDRAGRVNSERIDAQQQDGFTTTTISSQDVRPGTRWDYRTTSPGTFTVRNLSNGRQFTLVRCSPATHPQPVATPTFADPVALVTWLIGHSSGGFEAWDDAANANVFSPGLREALRMSFLRSRQQGEPPCGADGNIILDMQENGAAHNLRLSSRPTAPDRVTVAASFDVDGYHRDRRFMTVNLDGVWKLENIVQANGSSLRRSLDCRR